MAKRKGAFSEQDNKMYASSLLELGQAAQSLALLQQTGQIKDFSVLLQNPSGFALPPQPQQEQRPTSVNHDQKNEEQKIDEVTDQQLQQQHFGPEDLLPPNNEDPYEDVNDSVAILSPKKDAAVAEAKPVGLSIAGEGGVASSKPNAIALSGRNGLAVASPKATAIAGVSPEEAAAFSIGLPTRNQLVIKTPNSVAEKTGNEDYDYGDVQLTAGRFPLSREPPAVSLRLPIRYTGGSAGGAVAAGDALVQKWRNVIAEDYAAATPVIRAAPNRRPHYE